MTFWLDCALTDVVLLCRVPLLKLEESRGLSNQQVSYLIEELNQLAKNMIGKVVI